MNRPRRRLLLACLAAWVVVALPVAAIVFVHSDEQTSLAGHEAVVSAAFDGYATLDLGPFVPNLRYPTESRFGARIDFGKTRLGSYDALINRYAVIGAQPEGEIAKVVDALRAIAVDSAVSGALAGLAGPAILLLLGSRRRTELARQATPRRAVVVALALAVLAAAMLQPWERRDDTQEQASSWRPIREEVPGVPLPEQAQPLEVEAGLFTTGTRRLAESLLDSYARSARFYGNVLEAVPTLQGEIREPQEGETVALLVSDRHDNVRMDKVAHAIGELGGATILLDAGDDTSTGSPWEAFSLDSLDRVFDDYEHRFAVTGNHDQGDFVGDYFEDLGFERFHGEAVEGPDGIILLGADDPRSSGLGSWRDEVGLSFRDHAMRVADQACEYDEEGRRVATLLVHDVDTGGPALERGCVDLVVGGHLHERLGPTEVVGDNGLVGYSYTTGTTGGAAYAIAIGSKIRRNAQVTLITYRDSRPVGLQPVTIRTVGDFQVTPYIELDPQPGTDTTEEGPDDGSDDAPDLSPGTTNGPDGESSP